MVMDLHGPRSILAPTNVREFKIVVIGPRKVGKSALVVRFLTKRFINDYLENTDMTCNGVADVDGEPLHVNVQDTSEKAMRLASIEHYFRWADAVMLVYSITDPGGFRQLQEMVTRFLDRVHDADDKEASRPPPVVLVGNKSDLHFARRVNREEGFELSRRLHCEFYECSAREGWSKQITRPNCKRAAQDTLNTAAVAATAIGVGMLGTAPPRTLCPNSHDTSDLQRSKSVQLKRYHVRSLSVGTSAETDGSVPTSPTSSRTALRPDSGASLSEDDSDESKRSFNYFGLPKSRLCLRSNSLIGKLSPRLCRKFSKMDDSRNAKKDTASKVASAKDFRKKGNSVLSGLSSSLFTASAITPESVNSDFCRRESASCCSTSTSTTGSTESLTSCSPESDGREAMIWRTAANANNNNHLPRREEKDRTVNGGRLSFCSPATCPAQLQDKESVGWEPFLQLCRDGRAHRTRVRSRSPSNFLRNGFKRIRSLAAETGSHNNHHGHKTLFGAPSIAISKS